MIQSGQARKVKVNRVKMLSGNSRGFTLLELLISLTIVALIVVIIFGALRIGIRAWEKGEKDVDVRQRQRIVLDLIKRQLASTCVSDVWGKDQQLVSLKGDNKSIAFVSHIPMTPGNRFGLVYVQYAVKKEEGNKLLNDIIQYSTEYLRFAVALKPENRFGLEYPIGINMQSMIEIYRMGVRLKLDDMVKKIEPELNKFYSVLYSGTN